MNWSFAGAKPGESLKLLNGNTIELDETVGVIADNQAVESLAGIMGGDATAVSDDTKNVYVEAAFWWPKAVMGRSRRFNFSTDAGHRFERGVDPALTVEHIERITQLILEICGGEAGPMDDQIAALPERKPVALRVARAVQDHRHADQRRPTVRDRVQRLGLEFIEGDGRADRDATELAFRHPDRRRSDRGSHPRAGLPEPARHAAAGACDGQGDDRNRAARSMHCAMRWPAAITSRRSTSASSKRAGNRSWPATTIRSSC